MSVTTETITINENDYNLTLFTDETVVGVTSITYFDASFNNVGTKVSKVDSGEVSYNLRVPTDDGYVEVGYYTPDGTDAAKFSWEYTYDAEMVFVSGVEIQDDITSELNSNWEVTSETYNVDLSPDDLLDGDGLLQIAPSLRVDGTYKIVKSEYENTFRTVDGVTGYEYIWSDEDAGTSGSTFFDADDNWVGDTFTDGYLIVSNFVEVSDGGRTETGSYKETSDGEGATADTLLFERTYEYTFNAGGEFVSGYEIVDGEKTEYGANWAVTGKSYTKSLEAEDAAENIPVIFKVDGSTYSVSETVGTDTETTYYSAPTDGVVLGRALSFSFDDGATTGATFYDAEWNWIGDIYSDGVWSSERFVTDNGNGTKTETGSESDGVWDRSWTFIFSDDGDFKSGFETVNGITTTFGEDWEVTGKSADVLPPAITDEEILSEVPSSFLQTNDDSESYVLAKTVENPWGDETTYFSAEGEIIGYGFSWEEGDSSGTHFNDANWEPLGEIYIDATSKFVRFEVREKDDDGQVVSITETGAEYLKNEATNQFNLERSWTFKFDADFNLLEGEETKDGITTEFGAGWEFIGDTVDLASDEVSEIDDLAQVITGEIKLSDVFNFVATVDGVDVTKGYSTVSSYEGGSEVTYLNAAGDIVGRKSSYTFTDGEFSQTGSTYFDGDWNWVGDIFSDENWSGSRFELKLEGGGRREIGSETDLAYEWSRSYDYTYAEDGDLLEGTDTENGVTTTYGEDWLVTGRTANMDDATTIVDPAALAELPSTFLIDGQSAQYTIKEGDWGSEKTYFDADGVILGYAYSWDDGYASGTSFNDANWNFLGDIFIAGDSKNVRFEVVVDGVRTETGAEYQSDGEGGWTEIRSWSFNFDENWNMLGGTETRADGVEVEFDAGWIIKSEKIDVDDLTEIDDLDAEISAGVKYSDIFDFTVEGEETLIGYSKTTDWDFGGSQTVFYNGIGEIVGRSETYAFDESEQSTQYFDEDWMWIGEVFSGSEQSRTIFTIENGEGGYTEFGSETFDGNTRSWEYNFSEDWDFLGGTETENGLSRNLDDTGKKGELLIDFDDVELTPATEEELAELPDVFKYGEPEQAQYLLQTHDYGDEKFYFDAENNPIGRSTSWSDPGPYGGSGTDYFDIDDEYIGGVFEDDEFKSERFEIRTEDEDGNVTSIIETGAEYESDDEGGWTEVRSYNFEYDAFFNLQEGTETFMGTTTEYGKNWKIKDKTVIIDEGGDFEAVTEALLNRVVIDLELGGEQTIENGYVTFGDILDVESGFTKTGPTDWGIGQETTFYTADGKIIGRYIFEEDGAGSETYRIFDKDWNWVGEFGTEIFDGREYVNDEIRIEKEGGGYYEFFVQEEIVADEVVFSRKHIYEYNDDGDLIGGKEVDNGITFLIGEDGSYAQQARTDLGDLRITSDDDDDYPVSLGDLPDSFKFDEGEDEIAAYADIVISRGNNKQVDYYNASGEKIGESYSFLDYSGELVTDFQDGSYNFLGQVREKPGQKKEVVTRSEETIGVDDFGSPIIHSTEIRTISIWDAGEWKVDVSENYTFGPDGLVSGQETRDGITTVYGEHWTIISTQGDVNSLEEVDSDSYLLASDDGTLADLYDFGDQGYYASREATDAYMDGSSFVDTTYYNDGGVIVGYSYKSIFNDAYNDELTVDIRYEDATGRMLYSAEVRSDTTVEPHDIIKTLSRYIVEGDGTYTEIESEISPEMIRTSEFIYDSETHEPISGQETENGITTVINVVDGMWVREAPTIDLGGGGDEDLAALGITVITGDALNDIPSAFIIGSGEDAKAYKKFDESSSEYHYYGSDGAKLGVAFVNSYEVEDGIDEVNTTYNDNDYQWLGSVNERTESYKDTHFESSSVQNIDGVSTDVIIETQNNYSWIGDEWKETSSSYFMFEDTAAFEKPLISGFTIDGTLKTNWGPSPDDPFLWVVTGTEYYADGEIEGEGGTGTLSDITIPILIEAVPSDWGSGGDLQAIMQPDPYPNAYYDFDGEVTYYDDGDFLGTANVQLKYTTPGDPNSGVREANIRVMNGDMEEIGYTNVNSDPHDGSGYTETFVVSKIPQGIYYGSEEVFKQIYVDSEGRESVDISVEKFDRFGDLIGSMESFDGVTTHYAEDGNEIEELYNSAVYTQDVGEFDGILGEVVEDDDESDAVEGVLSDFVTFVDDQDDVIEMSLLRADSVDGNIHIKQGKFGSLEYDVSDQSFTYTIDNELANRLFGEEVGDEVFYLELKDLDGLSGYNHASYFEMRFDVIGAEDGLVVPYNPVTHDEFTDGLKKYVFEGFSTEWYASSEMPVLDENIAVEATLEIIGSENLSIIAETLGEDDDPDPMQEIATSVGKIFDIRVNGVSIADKLDPGYITIENYVLSENEVLGEVSGTVLNISMPSEDGSTYTEFNYYLSGPNLGTLTDIELMAIEEYGEFSPIETGSEIDISGDDDILVQEIAFTEIASLPVRIEPKFSLEVTLDDPISIFSGDTTLAEITDDNLEISEDDGTLIIDDIELETGEIEDALENGSLGISLSLGEFLPVFSRPYTQTITVVIRDVIGAADGVRTGDERELEAEFDLVFDGDGTTASVEAKALSSIEVNYATAEDDFGPINYLNSSDRVITFSDDFDELNFGFDFILDKISDLIGPDMITSEGTYEYEISGLGDLFEVMLPGDAGEIADDEVVAPPTDGEVGHEIEYPLMLTPLVASLVEDEPEDDMPFEEPVDIAPTGADAPVAINSIAGVINVVASEEADPLAALSSVNLEPGPTVNVGELSATVDVDRDGSSLIVQSISAGQDQIDDALGAGSFDVSFNLDAIGDTGEDPVTAPITVKILDVIGAADGERNGTEREITATFDLSYEGDGGDGAILSAAESDLHVGYIRSDGSDDEFTIPNGAEDIFEITEGTTNLTFNIASILDRVEDYIDSETLFSVGNYEYIISGLDAFLKEDDVAINTVKGEILVTEGATFAGDRPFSIDVSEGHPPIVELEGDDDLELGLNYSASSLNVSTIDLSVGQIEDVLESGALGVSFALDQIARYAELPPQNITVTVRDVLGEPNGMVNDGEREITGTFSVVVTGDGETASIEVAPETDLTVTIIHRDETETQTVYEDFEASVISVDNETSSFEFNIASILDRISGLVDSEMLSQPGSYEYEVSGLGTILQETVGDVPGPVNSIKGMINVGDDEAASEIANAFSLNIHPDNTPSLLIGEREIDVPVTFEGDVLELNDVMLDAADVQNVLETGNIAIGFSLDQLGEFDSPVTKDFTVTVRDVDGEPNGERNVYEREISATFSLTFESVGDTVQISSPSGSTLAVEYILSNGVEGEIGYDNDIGDIITIDPDQSNFSFNVGSVLSKVSGLLDDDILSEPGKYEYQISGLGDLLMEGEPGHLMPVNKIVGVFDVSDGPGLDIIDGVISFDPDGNPGTAKTEIIDISEYMESGENIVLPAEFVNALGSPDFNLDPAISLTVGENFIRFEEGESFVNETVRIELIEVLDGAGNKEEVRDAGERAIAVEIDLRLEKDGDENIITIESGDEAISLAIWGSSTPNEDPFMQFLPNADSDSLILTSNEDTPFPDTLNVKLASLLSKADSALDALSLDIPTAETGDAFQLNVGFVYREEGEGEVIEPMLSLGIDIGEIIVSDEIPSG